MALIVEAPADIGTGTVNYFRVSGWTKHPGPIPNLPGSKGRVVVSLAGYDSEDARRAGVAPRAERTIQIAYGENCADAFAQRELPKEALAIWGTDEHNRPKLLGYSDQPAPPAVLCMKTDQPVDADIYAALKTLPDYAEATDHIPSEKA